MSTHYVFKYSQALIIFFTTQLVSQDAGNSIKVAFAHDEQKVISTAFLNDVIVRDLRNNAVIFAHTDYEDPIVNAHFLSDSQRLFIGSMKSCRLWDQGKFLTHYPARHSDLLPDETTIVNTSLDEMMLLHSRCLRLFKSNNYCA